MTSRPLTVERFGGLQLVEDPGEVALNGAVDLLNVDCDRRGRLRQRDGYAKYTAAAGAARYNALSPFYTASGTRQVVANRNGTLQALDSSGANIATSAASTGTTSFARVGTDSAEYLYVLTTPASGGVPTWTRWDGTAFSSPAGMPSGVYLGISPTDNRLVAADGATGTRSRVRFSDAGAPETFGANNYVDLRPGDGESIQGICTWREYWFVFKASAFFVFYGTSTDSVGNPIFNYRPIVGVGLDQQHLVTSQTEGISVVAGTDGVYFLNRRGVYRTTGGQAELISRAIDPFFRGGAPAMFASSTINQGSIGISTLAWYDERLYVAVPTGSSTTNDRVLVYDPALSWWSLYNFPVNGLAGFRKTNAEELLFSYATGTNDIARHSSSSTDDAGASITSRYRTGFFEPGGTVSESVIREVILDGIGTVAVKGSTNWGSLGSATNVTLGTSPATAQGRARVAQRGRQHSYQFEGVSGGAWTLNEATFNVREGRPPGLKSA